MPKKNRTITISPIEQSSALAYINAIWIRPLLRMRPANMSVAAWLNFIFLTHERSIDEYVALETFSLPGLLKDLPLRVSANQKKVFRKIKIGTSIWMRRDTSIPDRFEVETTNGVGGKVQLFQLTGAEWQGIQRFMRTAPKRRKKRKELPSISKPNALSSDASNLLVNTR